MQDITNQQYKIQKDSSFQISMPIIFAKYYLCIKTSRKCIYSALIRLIRSSFDFSASGFKDVVGGGRRVAEPDLATWSNPDTNLEIVLI